MQFNYSSSLLVSLGYVLCFEEKYSTIVPYDKLKNCATLGPIAFVGAYRKKTSNTDDFHIDMGAFTSTYTLVHTTTSTSTAVYDPISKLFWYNVNQVGLKKGFGFASSKEISLKNCDTVKIKDNCADRMCWGYFRGGWRAGCNINLHLNSTWIKVVYILPGIEDLKQMCFKEY